MNKCYNLKKYNYNDGLLNRCIDATYIIHLNGNGRLKSIKEQLNIFHPSNTVYILFNKGFKKCKKDLPKQASNYDLIDAYLYIYKDAKNKNYNNILILEDDFIFNDIIKDNSICNDVINFVNEKQKEKLIYRLGCLPIITYKYNTTTRFLLVGSGAHAVIYSRKFIDYVLEQKQDTINDWDDYLNLNKNQYTYYKPLCYQLFPETENMNTWSYFKLLNKFYIYVVRLLKLDKQTEPGYSYFYMLSNYIPILIILLIVLIVILVIMKIKKKD
jgi:hypothetical protein